MNPDLVKALEAHKSALDALVDLTDDIAVSPKDMVVAEAARETYRALLALLTEAGP